jgi:diguanylate cyclase (GGDEF)-like protein/PAS domain S-box-containing protein
MARSEEMTHGGPEQRNAWPIVLVALIGLTFSVLAWVAMAAWEDQKAKDAFAIDAGSHLDLLQEGFSDFQQALHEYHGDVSIMGGLINRTRLDIEASDLLDSNPGISSLIWAPRVASVNAREHFPISFATTRKAGHVFVGLDLATNLVGRALLAQARDSGELTVSGIVPFRLDAGDPEFIAVQSVYYDIATPISIGARRRDLVGFTLGTFRLRGMVDGALIRLTRPRGLHVYVYRDGAAASDLPMDIHTSRTVKLPASPLRRAEAEAQLHVSGRLTLGNRSWLAIMIPARNPLLGLWRWQALAVFAVSLMVCALATSYTRSFGRRRRREKVLAREFRALADRYSTIFDSVNDGIFILDPQNGSVIEVNKIACDMYEYTRDEFVVCTFETISSGVSPYTQAEGIVFFKKLFSEGPQEFEWRAKRKDGSIFWVDVSASRASFVSGPVVLVVVRDISKRKSATQQLSDSETRLQTVLDTNVDGIAMIDMETKKFTYGNRAFCDLIGYGPNEIISFGVMDLHEPDALPPVWEYFKGFQDRELQIAPNDPIKRKDGTIIFVDITVAPMTLGGRNYLLGCFHDVTERKRAEEQIIQMEHYDRLTGLVNRHVFVEALEQAIASARRDVKTFAVLSLDLDHFKDVNDTLGRSVGDLLLKGVAARLRGCVRASDTVARFGGDEFAIILTDIGDPIQAAVVSERVRSAASESITIQGIEDSASGFADKVLGAFSEPFHIHSHQVRSSTSIGIAIYGVDSPDTETLLAHADVALYRAKAESRGTYRFFDRAMDVEVRARFALGIELRQAIDANELFLMYQPQVDIESGRIVGLEALVRWQHPRRGVVGPGAFIPEAERNGLIVPLGHWVMREACRQTKEWLDAGIAPPSVAVNLSGVQFKRPRELERDIAAIVAEFDIPVHLLELELTESVLMGASPEHSDVVLRFREAGHRIAIDDFGSGYSSLDYLRRYHVDRIKIAQSFITDVGKGLGNDAIVRATIGLARDLGVEMVVEGVETAAQLALLKSWGCCVVQGFYFSRPVSASKTTALLRLGIIIPPPADTVEIPALGI